MGPVSGVRFTFDGIAFEPRPERLVFSPEQPAEDVFLRIAELAGGIFKKLPHTPITAVGLNFDYQVPEEQCALAPTLFDAEKMRNVYEEAGLPVLTVHREVQTLAFSNHVLNLAYDSSASPEMISFNFHYETPTAPAVEEAIADYPKKLKLAESVFPRLLKPI